VCSVPTGMTEDEDVVDFAMPSPTRFMASASSMFGGLMRLTGTAPRTSILNSMPSAYEPMQTDTDALSGDRVGFFSLLASQL